MTQLYEEIEEQELSGIEQGLYFQVTGFIEMVTDYPEDLTDYLNANPDWRDAIVEYVKSNL
jgi:hypothetical protein